MYILEPSGNRLFKESNRNPLNGLIDNIEL